MAIVLVLLLGVAAFAVDFGFAYFTGERAQNAADAAALSGAALLPQSCTTKAATAEALNVASSNGFTNNGGSTLVTVTSHCEDSSATGPKANQIRVQVQTKVHTLFGRIFGVDDMTVKRVANAEFDPPINLGNPTSNFGSAPDCPLCSQTLMLANMASQLDPKANGNAIAMGWCGSAPADNCQGGSQPLNNKDRDTNGELFEIDNSAQGQLVVHLFDPAFVDDGDTCQGGVLYGQYPSGATPVFPANAWGTSWYTSGSAWLASYSGLASGARFRPIPANSPNSQYCPGDNVNTSDFYGWDKSNDEAHQATTPSNTTYSLYELTDLLHPLNGQVVCSFTYKGFWGPANLPRPGLWADPSEEASAESFNNWDDFTRRAGCDPSMLNQPRYALQVQTGSGTSKPGGGITNTDGSAGQNVYSVAACDANIAGCAGAPSAPPAADPNVAVSAITKMGLSVHTNAGSPDFYLARVPSWAAGETLSVDFYDIGDGDLGNGDLTLVFSSGDGVYGGPDGTGTTPIGEFQDCRASAPRSKTIQNMPTPWVLDQTPRPLDTDWGPLKKPMGAGCDVTITAATQFVDFNGKWFVVDIPIPADYKCDDSTFTSCWVKLRFDLGDQSVQMGDTTTWSAHLSADPDRLIK